MKATLEFTLPDEQADYRNAMNGGQWRSVVEHLDQLMRGWLKHGIPEGIDDAVERLRRELHEECTERGLLIYED